MDRTHILDEIFAYKREEVEHSRRKVPLAALQEAVRQAPPALDFPQAIRRKPGSRERPALIAEVKRGSPSRGLLRQDFDPLHLAQTYAENGAAAISVLTDERYFGGSLEHLRQIAPRRTAGAHGCLPLLRKDFIFDPYQVFEARGAGADALLLIVAGLGPGTLLELYALAQGLGMAPLVEVHNRAELEAALTLEPALIGINNRDLNDFSVRLETTEALRPLVPPETCVVAESGIHSDADVQRLSAAGVDAILVGEALVTALDVGAKVRELAGSENYL